MAIQVEHFSPRIVVITISRPQALNALCTDSLNELNAVIDKLQAEEALRVVIITGEGRAFIAGADISEMIAMTDQEAKDYAALGANLFLKIEMLNKITIAAINGFALGGGCELALACDIRIASDNAKFGQPEVRLGITPGFSGIRRMIEIVGEAKAKEFIFSGRLIEAQEAERNGLVNIVVRPEDLMKKSISMAEEIASKSFNAVVACKKVMNAMKDNLNHKILCQLNYFADCFNHKDQKVGMAAFLNKETAVF